MFSVVIHAAYTHSYPLGLYHFREGRFNLQPQHLCPFACGFSASLVTGGGWCVNTSAPSHLRWRDSFWVVCSTLILGVQPPAAHGGNRLDTYPLLASFPSLSHFPTCSVVLPGTSFQINDLHSNPHLRLCFWENPT